MPQHPHHPPHHHGPHPGRIVGHYNPALSLGEYAATLVDLGSRLSTSSTIKINRTSITVPASVEFQLIYERTPHGTFKLKLEADWPEEYGDDVDITTTSLLFGDGE